MSANGIKAEDDASFIKPENDVDDYEDTGECQIPQSTDEQNAWLTKLPKWLWQAWEGISEDDEIELGKVRIYNTPQGSQDMKIKIKLHDIPQHHQVPKLYDLSINKTDYNNTVVFSERDQPGFKAWNPNRVRRDNRDQYRVNKSKPYTSSIPKQTALAGYIKHEATVTAVENDEYRRMTDARFVQMFQPKRVTTFEAGLDHNLHSSMQANNAFNSFVKATQAKKPSKKKQQEKAVRISQEDLFDALGDCFREFRYWSLKALKQRLHQPEAYIKSTVEKVATLMRSGKFAMNYKLNPESEKLLNVTVADTKEEAAEVGEDDYDEDEGGDDDFEDVKMEEAPPA